MRRLRGLSHHVVMTYVCSGEHCASSQGRGDLHAHIWGTSGWIRTFKDSALASGTAKNAIKYILACL
jgi:hypothetical protein